jgi:hypothetical protein
VCVCVCVWGGGLLGVVVELVLIRCLLL